MGGVRNRRQLLNIQIYVSIPSTAIVRYMLICGVCTYVNRLMTLQKLYSVMTLPKLESLFLFRQLLIQLGSTAFAGVTSVA